jgi:hypothetical protein
MEEDAHVQCEGQRAPAGVKREVAKWDRIEKEFLLSASHAASFRNASQKIAKEHTFAATSADHINPLQPSIQAKPYRDHVCIE